MKTARDFTAPTSTPPPDPTGATNPDDPSNRAPADAFKHAKDRVAELREYAAYLIAAKVDALKLTARSIVFYAILGVVAGIIAVGLLVTGAVLLLGGLAGAIGAMFEPDRPWAGALIVGFVVVAGALAGTMLMVKRLTNASRAATVKKYEQRQQSQKSTFGHDVQERAREHAEQQH